MSELSYRPASEVWKDSAREMANPPKGVPLAWWPAINRTLGGLRPHELTLLCAPTGAGKTQLLANLSAQFLVQGVPHFVAPVETGDVDYMARVASALDRAEYNSGEKIPEQTILASTERNAPLWLKTPMNVSNLSDRVEIEDMIAMLRYQQAAYGAQVALLDNLNFFLNVVSSQMEKAEMDNAIHKFVVLAKKLPMHVILIVHPRKTEKGRVESEFDIKGSSTAVQEASNVLLFNRPTADDVHANRRKITDREMIFRKIRRRGRGVGQPLWLQFDRGRFEEFTDETY